jgi:hypothetical protein
MILVKNRIFRSSILLFGVGLCLIGCGSLNHLGIALSNPPTNTIGELQPSSGDITVNLQGKVIKVAPFLGSGAYQIQDNTGTIWVLTEKGLPQPGAEIAIQGQVKYQPIPIGRQEMGEMYILEMKQQPGESQAQTPPQPEIPVQPATLTPSLPASPPPVQAPAPAAPAKPQPPLEQDDLFLPHK